MRGATKCSCERKFFEQGSRRRKKKRERERDRQKDDVKEKSGGSNGGGAKHAEDKSGGKQSVYKAKNRTDGIVRLNAPVPVNVLLQTDTRAPLTSCTS